MPRRRKTLLDLTDELDAAMKPWRCPQCRKSYSPPVTTYISPIDGRERCVPCAERSSPA